MTTDAAPGPESTDQLVARLATLPKVSKPFFGGPEHLRANVHDADDLGVIADIMSPDQLNYLRTEVFTALPDVAARVGQLGPAGVRLQARLSNSVNAVTIPTADGVVMVYNLGLLGLQYSVALAVGVEVQRGSAPSGRPVPDPATVAWLSLLLDWATSPAGEPRTGPVDPPDQELAVDDAATRLAGSIAAASQRFALCHELGHVLALVDERTAPTNPTPVGDTTVDALTLSLDREYAADRAGLELMLALLAQQGKDPVGALLGAELFLNAVGMMDPFIAPDERATHPDPDERLVRIRDRYRELDEGAAERIGAAIALRGVLESLRGSAVAALTTRRERVSGDLERAVAAYAQEVDSLTQAQRSAAAAGIARHLLRSPGATLSFLHDGITAPLAPDEPATGSPTRILLYNAALHLEAPLRSAIGLRV